MFERQSFSKTKMASERSVATVFAVVFAIIGLWPLLSAAPPRIWALVVTAALAAIAIVRPSLFRVPTRLWLAFGSFLGTIMAPVVMAVLYAIVILPTAFVLRLVGKRPASWRDRPDARSYWVARREQPGPMTEQY